MNGLAVTISLSHKRNSGVCTGRGESGAVTRLARRSTTAASALQDFLRVPPFPGSKADSLRGGGTGFASGDLVELIRSLRVGGSYWAVQPPLPSKYTLVRSAEALRDLKQADSQPVVLWTSETSHDTVGASLQISGECDPWHMLVGATMLVTSRDDELCPIATLLGVPIQVLEETSGELSEFMVDPVTQLGERLSEAYRNPFTDERMSTSQAIELCGFWRRLVDGNRDLAGGLGFAFWKQNHVGPLLWAGSAPFSFLRSAHDVKRSSAVAVWRAKVPVEDLAVVQDANAKLVEVEDGFLRSQGLGADCVPPLSITVDRLGPHFDPRQASELELLLQEEVFDREILDRARRLRQAIVRSGIGKYEQGRGDSFERVEENRRYILVPGQVEDDRAVLSGGCGLTSNLDLLARVRADAPDASILYKPHPDVLAGHRRGVVTQRDCLEHADQIVERGSISSLIESVDEVHVNTSLAGFEALLRGKPVTTHGVPFYAGWGLTRDFGPVPDRRNTRRTIDELVAATLLLYPRYLDPVTGLPCPAEVLVERLSNLPSGHSGVLTAVRRMQGKFMRSFRNLAR